MQYLYVKLDHSNEYLMRFRVKLRPSLIISHCFMCMWLHTHRFMQISSWKRGPWCIPCWVIQRTYYGAVIMNAMASPITSHPIVYSTVYSGAENMKVLRHWLLWVEFTAYRWIPRTKGLLRGTYAYIWWRHHEEDQTPGLHVNLQVFYPTALTLLHHN